MRTFTITLTRYGREDGAFTFDETGAVTAQQMENMSGDGKITDVRGFGDDEKTLDLSIRAFLRAPQSVVGMHPHISDTHFGDSVLFAVVQAVVEN